MPINFDRLTQKHIIAGINWISNMSRTENWNLSANEVATLLSIDLQTYEDILLRLNKGESISLPNETLERLSLLLGIWKHLQLCAPSGRRDIAISTFNLPTSCRELKGISIKQFLLKSNGTDAFYAVKSFLSHY